MARFSYPLVCLTLVSASLLGAAEQGQLDYSPVLFTVMAAYDAGHATANNTPADPLRAAVRKEILAKNPAVLKELRQYLYNHRKDDPGSDLAQYVSFSLVATEPPSFKLRLSGIEVPPDVQALSGFPELMSRFYEQAGIAELWPKVQGHYEKALEQFHEPVTRTVLEANGYLRNPTSGYMGRKFQIFVDLMTPSSQVHTRSYKDDYFVVVSPPVAGHIDDIRHAYLHYLLDPLATKFYDKFERVRGLIDLAQAAPALDENYKGDFLLLATESLIKAVEARLTRQPALAQQAAAEGFILVPFFSEHLIAYEKQEAAMRLYLGEMLDSLDLRKEDKRLARLEFAKTKTVRKAPPAPKAAEPEQSPIERDLETADKMYSARDLDAAREAYLKIVRQSDSNEIKSRGYYGLARVAALKNEAELAEQLFRKTLELSPDPHTRSWTEVYLGRIAEGYGEKEKAAQHYKSALAVEGAPPGARQAAEQGAQKLMPR